MTKKIIIFEYDTPINQNEFINFEPGIWWWKVENNVKNVTDNHSVVGFYEYFQNQKRLVKSVRVDGILYSRTLSLSDCRLTDSSFYYDYPAQVLYVHFKNFENKIGKRVFYGSVVGYSQIPNNDIKTYWNDYYYEPRLVSVSGLKKSIDPLFFGLLKYQTGSVKLINTDGHFDNWRDKNLWGQGARIMVGGISDPYDNFETVFEGAIQDDSRDFDEFTVKLEDLRRSLTQPIATNRLTKSEFPYLNDNNSDEVKPVAYGTIYNAKAICLNEDEASPTYRTFLIADTEFNMIYSLDKIYVDEIETALTGTVNLSAGTFTMTTASVNGNEDKVTIDFIANTKTNGVEIIKDLLYRYDGKPYLQSFFDTNEIDLAATLARNTSLYVSDGSTKLSEGIESVCNDIDARFFVKNNGLYTIRIYDPAREENAVKILNDEWLSLPELENNGSEYLTSVIITYRRSIENDYHRTYENTNYKDSTFEIYKKLKVETFDTNLYTIEDAQDKSETIMSISKKVNDIIKRQTTWEKFGIEPGDFIVCDPISRPNAQQNLKVFEVVEVQNDVSNFKIKLGLRYVRDYIEQPEIEYHTIDDNTNNIILDNEDRFFYGYIA